MSKLEKTNGMVAALEDQIRSVRGQSFIDQLYEARLTTAKGSVFLANMEKLALLTEAIGAVKGPEGVLHTPPPTRSAAPSSTAARVKALNAEAAKEKDPRRKHALIKQVLALRDSDWSGSFDDGPKPTAAPSDTEVAIETLQTAAKLEKDPKKKWDILQKLKAIRGW